jgi:dTDP-4-amino-4,6-dideoxygalactose transaminase
MHRNSVNLVALASERDTAANGETRCDTVIAVVNPREEHVMTSVSIPVMKPVLPTIDAVNVYLERVYASGIFSNHGPLVRELEQRYADWFNVPAENVVAVVNGTVAISAAALWEDNPTYLSPEWTFPATAMGVLSVGGSVEFRDVDPEAWTLSVTDDDVARADSVVPLVVAPFGHPIDLSDWSAFPRIIIDAAACAGNRPDLSGMKKGWAATISLHATKVLGCGEGGLVIFADPARAQIAREWINFGFSGSRITERVGTNGKMSEFAAAFALAALDDVDTELRDWGVVRDKAAKVNTQLGLSGGPMSPSSRIPYWLIAAPSVESAAVYERELADAGIQTRRWWPASLTETTPFRDFPTSGNSNSRFLAETVIGLPMFRSLSDEQFDRIRDVLAAHKG